LYPQDILMRYSLSIKKELQRLWEVEGKNAFIVKQ